VTPITQTVDRYVVTLYPTYANTNLIVMTYTVKRLHMSEDYTTISLGPSLKAFSNNPSLADEAGRSFPSIHPSALFQDYSTNYVVFDAQQLGDSLPTDIHLHLVLDELTIGESEPGSLSYGHELKAPITFEFSMPVDRVRRIGDVNQTVTTRNGDTVTIDKVIATRHDVRIIWRVDRRYWPAYNYHNPFIRDECCRLRLRDGNKSITFWPLASSDTVVRDQVAASSLFYEGGEWVISAWYVPSTPIVRDNIPPDQPGPVFRFTMPPAQNH
jgi:hypothetical protein